MNRAASKGKYICYMLILTTSMLQGLKPSLPIADVFPVVSSQGFLVNKFIFIMQAAVKMHGIVYIFQICAVAVASIIFPKMVKKNEGILNRQSLLTAKMYSHSFQKLLIFLSKKFKKIVREIC